MNQNLGFYYENDQITQMQQHYTNIGYPPTNSISSNSLVYQSSSHPMQDVYSLPLRPTIHTQHIPYYAQQPGVTLVHNRMLGPRPTDYIAYNNPNYYPSTYHPTYIPSEMGGESTNSRFSNSSFANEPQFVRKKYQRPKYQYQPETGAAHSQQLAMPNNLKRFILPHPHYNNQYYNLVTQNERISRQPQKLVAPSSPSRDSVHRPSKSDAQDYSDLINTNLTDFNHLLGDSVVSTKDSFNQRTTSTEDISNTSYNQKNQINYLPPNITSNQIPQNVIELVRILRKSPDSNTLSRTATNIQQISYADVDMKNHFREAGAIETLLAHLQNQNDSLLISILGALKNLSFGVENNKFAIGTGWGLSSLMQVLSQSRTVEVRELTTTVLWNVSSCQSLRECFLDSCVFTLINDVIIPLVNLEPDVMPLVAIDNSQPSRVKWTNELKNSTGVLKNIASFGKICRKKIRKVNNFVESLFYIVCNALGREDIDNQIVENAMSILRHLSYEIGSEVDVQHGIDNREIKYSPPLPVYNRKIPRPNVNDTNTSNSCFSFILKIFRRRQRPRGTTHSHTTSDVNDVTESFINPEMCESDYSRFANLPKGFALLWQPEISEVYIRVLTECSNKDTLEATLGAILNLAACNWKWGALFRTSVRNLKGLATISNILNTIEYDSITKDASICLRNLSLDYQSKVLIGEYALLNMIERLPGGKHCSELSESTYQNILGAITEFARNCPDNINRIHQSRNAIPIFVAIANSSKEHQPKTVYYASKLCMILYQESNIRPILKREGWTLDNWQKICELRENDFSSFQSDTTSAPLSSKNPSFRPAIYPPRDHLREATKNPNRSSSFSNAKSSEKIRTGEIGGARHFSLISDRSNPSQLPLSNFRHAIKNYKNENSIRAPQIRPTHNYQRQQIAPHPTYNIQPIKNQDLVPSSFYDSLKLNDTSSKGVSAQEHFSPIQLPMNNDSELGMPTSHKHSHSFDSASQNPRATPLETEFTIDDKVNPRETPLTVENDLQEPTQELQPEKPEVINMLAENYFAPNDKKLVTSSQIETIRIENTNSIAKSSPIYSKVDISQKRERRRTTQVKEKELKQALSEHKKAEISKSCEIKAPNTKTEHSLDTWV